MVPFEVDSRLLPLFPLCLSLSVIISILTLARLVVVLLRPRPSSLGRLRPPTSSRHPTRLLIVLGSGGHTAEMLDMLRRLPHLPSKFSHRTYVISSGDSFSALKAKEFEHQICGVEDSRPSAGGEQVFEAYDIVTVRRARRVHQSLLTTPWSVAVCLWDCLRVLAADHPYQAHTHHRLAVESKYATRYPDLILTNGPGTGACVVLASVMLLLLGFSGTPHRSDELCNEGTESLERGQQHSGQMRTIFIESWARVKTLSLTGKLLVPLVDRYLIQWPSLKGSGAGKAELVGTLIT